MMPSKFTTLFHDPQRQQRLRWWTFWMFVFLAVEKVFAGEGVVYENRALHFSFSLTEVDVICIAVYTAVAVLIALRVKYVYLLFPDFVLFGVKLYTAAAAIAALAGGPLGTIDTLTAVETAAESILFALFLAVLFAGKLGHPHSRVGRRYPLYCMRLLLCCFPVTIAFEVLKCVVAGAQHLHPVVVTFNCFKGIVGEALLDLPYYLLIFLLCFVPQKHGEHHI